MCTTLIYSEQDKRPKIESFKTLSELLEKAKEAIYLQEKLANNHLLHLNSKDILTKMQCVFTQIFLQGK